MNQSPAHINVPPHVAIIMDGNGRWATEQGLERIEGHKAGALSVRKVVEHSVRRGVQYLTLYAFSTENWQRPQSEINALMSLFNHYLDQELQNFLDNDVRLRAIGDLSKLPKDVQDSLSNKLSLTSHCRSLNLCLALSYGGRAELVHATKQVANKLAQGTITESDINEELICSQLYAPDIPDPDLLIRTSNEQRISNFLLWQLAYSELVFTETHWPDFDEDCYDKCLSQYAMRKRRFGKTSHETPRDNQELT